MRRLQVWLRQHHLRLIVFFGALVFAWVFLYAANHTQDEHEQGFCYVLAGAALTAAGSTIVQWIFRGEAFLQGSYTERAKVIRDIIQEARKLKQSVVDEWNNARPSSASLYTGNLGPLAFYNRPFIGKTGIKSIGVFIEGLTAIARTKYETRQNAEAAVDLVFERLHQDLMGLLGMSAD